MQALGLTRTLQANNRSTRIARVLQELGRLIKRLYLLRSIDDAHYPPAHPCSELLFDARLDVDRRGLSKTSSS